MPQFLDGQGVIDLRQLGHHRWPMIIQPHGISSKYTLKMSGIKDLVSKNSQTDTSDGPCYYIHPTTGELVTVAAGEPLAHPTLGNVSFDTFGQFLTSPLSPANQTTASLATGEYFLWILGSGSVAVSANSATITGAGSATEATGVNFQVTVAGTVSVTITGECTHFQLTTGNASLYPIFHNTTGLIASRAGTTKLAALSTGFPKFYDALDGAADGVELWTGATVLSTGWADNLDGTYSCDGSQSAATWIAQAPGIIAGVYAENTLTISAYLSGTVSTQFEGGGAGTGTTRSANGTYIERRTAKSTGAIYINCSSDFVGTVALSVKKISPAAARHQFTWTPGVDYTKWTAVKSIMGSDTDHFLRANATGGVVLDDGTNELTNDINFLSGIENPAGYPMQIVYGYNEALDDYKMELSVYVDGSWVSVMGDFDNSFDPGTDFIYGLSNTYQSAVKGHTVEKLQQSHWKLYPTYAFNMPMTTGMVPYDLIDGGLLTSDLPGIRYDVVDGVLTEFAADEPVVTELGLRGGGVITQLCQWSEDPGEWTNGGLGSMLDTGGTFGPFTEVAFTDNGSVWNVAYIWRASVSGTPSGILYFCIRYRAGTSGNIRTLFYDGVASSSYTGTIGSTPAGSAGGELTIISDDYDSTLGYRVLKGSILFNNFSTSNSITIGPYSSTNKSILVLGADVSESPAILRSHIPSSGSNVTTVTEAGSAGYGNRLEDLSTEFPQLYDVIDGEADGVELVTDGGMETAPISNWTAYNALSAVELSTINSGLKSLKVTDNGASSRVYQAIATETGERYRINSYVYSESTNTGVFLARVAAVNAYNTSVSEYLTENKENADGAIADNTWQSLKNNFIATASTTYIVLVSQSNSGDVSYFDNISVQKITPATGELHIQWTPLYNAADISGTDHNIISWDGTTSSLTYDADNNLLKLTDGTNTASVACTPIANQTYEIKCIHGRHPTEGDDKMQVIVDSTAGTITDFVGSFSPGDDGVFCLNNDAHHYVKVLEVFKGDSSNKPPTWWI